MNEKQVIENTSAGPVTVETLKADLVALGVTPGMTLLVHSSLSALGWVVGGPIAVIMALEELLGPEGTLIMPTHTNYLSDPAEWSNPPVPKTWWDVIRQSMPPFQGDLTPARGMGAIPETFRGQNGVLRSNHPHFSFAAWGKHAAEITQPQPLDFGLGEGSVLDRIYRLDGWVLLLGVDHDNNTSLHLAEYRADFPGKLTIQVNLPLMQNGRRQWGSYQDVNLDETDFVDVGGQFACDSGLLIKGQVGQATAQLMPQRSLVDYAVPWMVKNRQPTVRQNSIFTKLIAEAVGQDFSGWDFGFIARRYVEAEPPWNYRQKICDKLPRVNSLLDMGTGGGEFLASLGKLPPHTWATEGHHPNLSVAKARLSPLSVQVSEFTSVDKLPFEADSFDMVINRHACFTPTELHRILKPGGTFITQQVGGANNRMLNDHLQQTVNPEFDRWNLAAAVELLTAAGFEIIEQGEAFPETVFYDIGAVVYYLKAIPWQLPDFSVDKYRSQLLTLHQTIQDNGGLTIKSHRFFIEARRRQE